MGPICLFVARNEVCKPLEGWSRALQEANANLCVSPLVSPTHCGPFTDHYLRFCSHGSPTLIAAFFCISCASRQSVSVVSILPISRTISSTHVFNDKLFCLSIEKFFSQNEINNWRTLWLQRQKSVDSLVTSIWRKSVFNKAPGKQATPDESKLQITVPQRMKCFLKRVRNGSFYGLIEVFTSVWISAHQLFCSETFAQYHAIYCCYKNGDLWAYFFEYFFYLLLQSPLLFDKLISWRKTSWDARTYTHFPFTEATFEVAQMSSNRQRRTKFDSVPKNRLSARNGQRWRSTHLKHKSTQRSVVTHLHLLWD